MQWCNQFNKTEPCLFLFHILIQYNIQVSFQTAISTDLVFELSLIDTVTWNLKGCARGAMRPSLDVTDVNFNLSRAKECDSLIQSGCYAFACRSTLIKFKVWNNGSYAAIHEIKLMSRNPRAFHSNASKLQSTPCYFSRVFSFFLKHPPSQWNQQYSEIIHHFNHTFNSHFPEIPPECNKRTAGDNRLTDTLQTQPLNSPNLKFSRAIHIIHDLISIWSIPSNLL